MVCTVCSKSYELKNGQCESCPDKCLTCQDGTCTECKKNYHPNSNGVCVKNCQLPCQECMDNQPTFCTACFAGSSPVNGQCVLDTACNSDSSCTNCGTANNYILNDTVSRCEACDSISNCIQCKDEDKSQCAKCASAYYIANDGSCANCPSECSTCASADVCNDCNDGYYLPEGQDEGSCLACVTPCQTCTDTSTNCMTCVSRYTKRGRICLIDLNVGFRIVIKATT